MQNQGHEGKSSEDLLPVNIPIFPLDGAILFPEEKLPLNIFETRYLEMISDALENGALIGMVQPRDPVGYALETQANVYDVGCAGRIVEHERTDDGRFLIVLEGVSRFRIVEEPNMTAAYRQAVVCYDEFAEDRESSVELGRIRPELIDGLRRYLDQMGAEADWSSVETLSDSDLVHALCMTCPFPGNEKQALLEALTLEARARVLMTLMALCGSPGEDQQSPPAH
jgi:Lon protease-like protein